MKKLMLGTIIGITVSVPVGVYAHGESQTPHVNYIYKAGVHDIGVFDDQDNKCYVILETVGADSKAGGISCVKR